MFIACTLLYLTQTSSLADTVHEAGFNSRDRELIKAYYDERVRTLPSGASDSSAFSPAVERVLVAGFRMPMQIERVLRPLPNQLEGRLSRLSPEYKRCTLGRHILVVKKTDLTITDILKNVALRSEP
jgi:hypothetical protein